uniref:HEAT repeat domain-containing protein n=1 Tax=Panagrellus redivivus TaxID=6233 RepID=A0A7E4VHG4_PANRE
MVARKLLREFDTLVKKCAKKWLNLPQRASAEPLYLANKEGGLNIIPVKILADISDVVQAIHLFGSKDPTIRLVAKGALQNAVKKRRINERTLCSKIKRLPINVDPIAGIVHAAAKED